MDHQQPQKEWLSEYERTPAGKEIYIKVELHSHRRGEGSVGLLQVRGFGGGSGLIPDYHYYTEQTPL
jgi:hypothetical protein